MIFLVWFPGGVGELGAMGAMGAMGAHESYGSSVWPGKTGSSGKS